MYTMKAIQVNIKVNDTQYQLGKIKTFYTVNGTMIC
jgi:hypothetical protein